MPGAKMLYGVIKVSISVLSAQKILLNLIYVTKTGKKSFSNVPL